MKIGLFGGTFDPIHLGHLIVAEEVREKLQLTKLMFVPAHHPWLKADKAITSARHRLAMVRAAVESNPFFEVSTMELERPGPSYTVDTVAEMKRQLSSGGELYFVAGSDAVADMPKWKDPDRLASLCEIVWVKRPGTSMEAVHELKAALPGVFRCLGTVDVPQVDISSTDIRERVARGASIRYLVPPEVEGYIRHHGLYLSAASSRPDG